MNPLAAAMINGANSTPSREQDGWLTNLSQGDFRGLGMNARDLGKDFVVAGYKALPIDNLIRAYQEVRKGNFVEMAKNLGIAAFDTGALLLPGIRAGQVFAEQGAKIAARDYAGAVMRGTLPSWLRGPVGRDALSSQVFGKALGNKALGRVMSLGSGWTSGALGNMALFNGVLHKPFEAAMEPAITFGAKGIAGLPVVGTPFQSLLQQLGGESNGR